jgi:aspartate aminotransferase
MTKAYRVRRDYVIAELKKMDGVKANSPHGAFYAFPDISSFFGKSDGEMVINNDDDMSMYLLNTGHVSTVCGGAFGNKQCIRLSFATSMENLVEAMKRMSEALSKLK